MSEETERQIVEELRNLNAVARKTSKATTIALLILGVFVVAFFATVPLRHKLYSRVTSPSQERDTWAQARTLMDEGEMDKGKEMLERLLREYPDYYYGHALLAFFYQEIGDLNAAEKSYAQAADLFPTEENEETLEAIREAIQRKERAAGSQPE